MLVKMKKVLKKEYIWIFFLIIVILTEILARPIEDLDEIWNFNIARNIAQGLIPYKDISMITTPFIAIIGGIFLKIFGQEIFVTRILATILSTAILWMIYKIICLLWQDKKIAMLVASLAGMLFLNLFCLDYNFGVLFLVIIILYQELKRQKTETNNKTSNKKELGIGILAGLAICTKQTIGILLAGITLLTPIIEIIIQKKSTKGKKANVKTEYWKNILLRALGVLLPVFALFLYLIITGAYQEFINYTIRAIPTFSNKIPYKSLFNEEDKKIAILSIILPIFYLICWTKVIIGNKEKDETKNLLIMLIYATPMLAAVYPIADKIHFLIGTLILMLTTIYVLGNLGKKELKKIKGKYKNVILQTIELFFLLLSVSSLGLTAIENINYYQNSTNKNVTLEHYKNCIIEDYLLERIQEVNIFIEEEKNKGREVYILDSEAAIYHIPLNMYYKNYDMFNKGNFGAEGEDGIIEEIKEKKNTVYLIRNKNINSNWQTPEKVIKYIRENLELVGQINMFEIYNGQSGTGPN